MLRHTFPTLRLSDGSSRLDTPTFRYNDTTVDYPGIAGTIRAILFCAEDDTAAVSQIVKALQRFDRRRYSKGARIYSVR